MPTIGDLYRITSKYVFLSQDMFNVDFKILETQPTNPLTDFELARSYFGLLATNIMPQLSEDCVLTSVLVENLTDGISFSEFSGTQQGGTVGEASPSLLAVGISLQRSTKVTRNGYKRISGIPESRVTGNQHTYDSTMIDNMERPFQATVVMDDLSNPPDTFEMSTVIVGRTPNAQGVYELDLTKINPVVLAVMNPTVTTQRTRKPGL